MAKVFVVNSAGHDYSKAEGFGEVVVMSTGTIDKFAVTRMFRIFHDYLASSSQDDFIVQSGPAVMNAIACAIFAAKHQKLNLLIWRLERDGSDHYVPRHLIMNHNKESQGHE